jgi:phage portal protein BeeE
MPNLWSLLRSKPEERYGLSKYAMEKMLFDGQSYGLYGGYTASNTKYECSDDNFSEYVRGAFKANGVVFACMAARSMVFSEVRFAIQEMDRKTGRPKDLEFPEKLRLFERPWPSAGTGDLLARAIQDVDLAGNHYVVRDGDRLRRLRPDWVEIVLNKPPDEAIETDVVGYQYTPGGHKVGKHGRSRFYLPEQVAHWAPIPDPEAQFRGQSWITPVLQEIMADKGASAHKKKFFDNAATPNLAVSMSAETTQEQFEGFLEQMDRRHQGVQDAYRTLYLGGGADVTVIGADMKQMDFKVTQGAGETRIAAAARVHPVIVGLSEGMQGSSLNAGNFKTAKDSFADGTMRPLWRSVCQAYGNLIRTGANQRLWYDDRDIQFLRADMTERAEVQQREASVIRSLVDGGFEPDSIVEAIRAQDWTLLVHTGLVSVQLLPPGMAGNVGATDPSGTPIPKQQQPQNNGMGGTTGGAFNKSAQQAQGGPKPANQGQGGGMASPKPTVPNAGG